MKKTISIFMLLIILSISLYSCGKKSEASYDNYKSSYIDYISSFTDSKNPKIKNLAEKYYIEIGNTEYSPSLKDNENIDLLNSKINEFAESIEKIIMPSYSSSAISSLYMTEDGFIKGDSTLASFSGYPEGKGDYYLAEDTTAVYSKSSLDLIFSLSDNELKSRLLKVTSPNEIFREVMISFTGKGEVVMSTHYTALGVEFMKVAYGKDYYLDQAEILCGTYQKPHKDDLNSNDYFFNVDFGGRVVSFLFNERDGSVSRKDLFCREVFSIYSSIMAATNGSAAYPNVDFEEGTEKYLNVKYGNRVMEKSYPDSPETEEARMREKMDVFVPKNLDTNRENGIIMAIHGGSWISGRKEEMHKICAEYTNAGYITVAINYTYLGKKFEDGETCTFLTMNDEINAAFKKIKELSDEYGWNIKKAATTGYSAGCHLALLYAYSYGNNADAPVPVVFTSGLVGPLDFHQKYWETTGIKGLEMGAKGLNDTNIFDGNTTLYDEETLEIKLNSISPLSFAKSGDYLPTLVGYGMMDRSIVPHFAAEELQEVLTDFGVDNDVIMFANSNHMMGNNPECGKIYRNKMLAYLTKYF